MANKKRRRRKKRGCATTAILIAIAVIVGMVGYFGGFFEDNTYTPVEGEAVFHFIDVGQADAALICTKDGNVLIDAGQQSSEKELKAYLDAHDIKEIKYAIFTHPHEDHIGGADMIMKEYKVENVILPDKTHDSATFRNMKSEIEKSGAKEIFAKPDNTYLVGGLKLTVLAPENTDSNNPNDVSVVVRVDFGGTSVMFTGDAEVKTEKEMLARYALSNKLDCDILKVGHHGSTTSSSEEFLRSVSPDKAIISCGKDNKHGHPHDETINTLNKLGIPYERTDELGSIVYATDGEKWTKK